MKKYFFFALAAAGMLSSCSSDDTVAGTEVENDELVPIQIGFGGGSVSVDETRGTGTVGGYQGTEENKWHSQKFNVYMLKKSTMEIAKFKLTPSATGEDIYNNSQFTAPGTAFSAMGENPVGPRVSGIARPDDNKIKYYPAQDNFDFYAYRLDDAATALPVLTDDAITLDFTIDGTQDIMVAKAYPTDAEKKQLRNLYNRDIDSTRCYSSFTARHGIQPTLHFRHLLTRFTFEVVPQGNSTDATSHIVIDSVKVVAKKTKGTLTVAKVGDVNGSSQVITWFDSQTDTELALMERDSTLLKNGSVENVDSLPLVDLGTWNEQYEISQGRPGIKGIDFSKLEVNQAYPIGDALLLAPESEYDVKVYGHQNILDEYGLTTTRQNDFVYKATVRKNNYNDDVFKAGWSYKITISLWGINNILVNAQLSGWNEASGSYKYLPEENNGQFVE